MHVCSSWWLHSTNPQRTSHLILFWVMATDNTSWLHVSFPRNELGHLEWESMGLLLKRCLRGWKQIWNPGEQTVQLVVHPWKQCQFIPRQVLAFCSSLFGSGAKPALMSEALVGHIHASTGLMENVDKYALNTENSDKISNVEQWEQKLLSFRRKSCFFWGGGGWLDTDQAVVHESTTPSQS